MATSRIKVDISTFGNIILMVLLDSSHVEVILMLLVVLSLVCIDAGTGVGTFGGLNLNGGGITSTSDIFVGTGIITCGGLNLNNGRIVVAGDIDAQSGFITCGGLELMLVVSPVLVTSCHLFPYMHWCQL